MNNSIKLALCGLAFVSAASFADDCVAPGTPPALPDGTSATLEQMLQGQQAVKDYQTVNTVYRTCLEPKIAAAETATIDDPEDPAIAETRKTLNDEYNASVSKEEELATQFNTELRAYKEANPS